MRFKGFKPIAALHYTRDKTATGTNATLRLVCRIKFALKTLISQPLALSKWN